MRDISLLIMAAGMGSRYGGLKQLDQVGPNGETIIDYSVYDAIKAGFTKIVFIIRDDFESQFKSQITNKYLDLIDLEFAYQDINYLPSGFSPPNNREKPWGTGHAILSAKTYINEPFVVINGDDFYGRESFKTIADYYQTEENHFSMVTFRLENTLSIFGGVTRGLCTIIDEKLNTVVETSNLEKNNNGVSSDNGELLKGDEPVSMNMWGFTPILFDYLEEKFINFLKEEGSELKSEYLIPSVINDLIQAGDESVHILNSSESWFGVTYKEDKPYVVGEIQKLIEKGVYPKKLFG
ncbi:sugar phosphate nucleotidyltransferase [bacterium]|jgi:dTDP-glucose pyrophosphorylase|nr:nucleotidyltransferase [Candidatus Neomarinimicrobiota bacterium]MDC0865493.1 sugar phosphate nucleotidyltransferase [bacterium]|tara:strand:+ start:207 stop:1091 length:885 start_codon:yes stop_codon:yes gene_type:complete